jgi:hypothetical protein
VPLDSESLGMECSEETDAFLLDRNAPRVINCNRDAVRRIFEHLPPRLSFVCKQKLLFNGFVDEFFSIFLLAYRDTIVI